MLPEVYRYTFAPGVRIKEAEATLTLSLLAVEGLYSQSRLSLEAGHTMDGGVVVIEARGRAGQDLNRLFNGFLTREFGPDGFHVERLPVARRRRPVPA